MRIAVRLPNICGESTRLWKDHHVVDKTVASAAEAVGDIADSASIAVGGFGRAGVPIMLVEALLRSKANALHIVSNNCGMDGWGLGLLLEASRIARVTGSYIGENKELTRQYLSGEIEVELVPQGSLSERLRAGGSGIPAFYTPAGVGTVVAEGGLPRRYSPDGGVREASLPKEVREFDGQDYVMEHGIVTDFALVRAWRGDRAGNLVYRKTAQNFNPLCAAAGRVTIAEVEELVEIGEIDPDTVHTPGIFVDRMVVAPAGAEAGSESA
jgi:3-oxoacid CoA-transferase subunit A